MKIRSVLTEDMKSKKETKRKMKEVKLMVKLAKIIWDKGSNTFSKSK